MWYVATPSNIIFLLQSIFTNFSAAEVLDLAWEQIAMLHFKICTSYINS